MSRLGAGVLGWGQPGASTPWKRGFDACGCIAADLYFQQLGTVSTQHSANVKVYCWDEVGDRDKWSDPEFHIDIVHIAVERSELREGPWRANRPVLLRWFHAGITRATNHWGWDAGRTPWRIEAVDPTALRAAQAEAITPDENARLLRKARSKGRAKTVVVVEEWRDSVGHRLVVYREGGPSDGTDALPDLTSVGLG